MTLAQKKARENFKKAIAYRKKTGCSLKQAFAYVKTGKVGAYKVIQKGENKNAKVTKVLEQKRTKTGKFASLKRVAGVKKAAKKKAVSSHKDTRSHNVNIRVVSGVENDLINKYKEIVKEIENYQDSVKRIKLNIEKMSIPEKVRSRMVIKKYNEIIRSLKKHKSNFKKNI